MEARKPLLEAGLFAPLVRSLIAANKTETELPVQILRALGNMCYDNEDNRDALLEIPDGIKAVSSCLDSDDPRLLQIACGALLNISMDNESVQLQVIASSGVQRLLRLTVLSTKDQPDPKYTNLASSSITTLSNLLEVEPGIKDLIQQDGLDAFFHILKKEHQLLMAADVDKDRFIASLEILDAVVTVLELVGENGSYLLGHIIINDVLSDTVQRIIVSQNLLNVLLDFVDHRPTFALPPREEDEDSCPSYIEIRKRISRIVTLVTMNGLAFSTSSPQIQLPNSDSNMIDIPKHADVMSRFKQWMTLGLHTGKELEEDEIRMSGALCIGNLSRSDEACAALVNQHGVAVALLGLLALEVERVKVGTAAMSDAGEGATVAVNDVKSCVKVVHAVVGAFKNLSIAVADRKQLGALGIIKPIASLLDIEVMKPVHFGCIGVLKNLCSGNGNELNAYRVITGLDVASEDQKVAKLSAASITPQSKTPLNKLIKYIWKATGDNLTGVRNEGGRVIVNLVRTCHLAGAPHLIKIILEANGITPLVQIVTGALLTRVNDDQGQTGSQVELNHHVHFDAVPSDGQVFPVVQNEGLVALILMANALSTSIPIITKYHTSLIPVAKRILLSGLPMEKTLTEVDETAVVSPASAQTPTPEEILYSDEIKVNVCLLLGVLATADATFNVLAAPEIVPVLERLTKWTSLSNLTVASAVSEKSALAYKEQATRGSATSVLSRTNTKSAKRVVSNEGGAGNGNSVNGPVSVEDLKLVEAIKRLKSVFSRSQ
ncbi:UNVERIFIED_CONTAM: Rap1 GTPase-GDP dissociation stimulator 1 [Siphonaria sp. JEL0065]|nr:Rap1 GTPase-GDP dissociation stimulator 1 [Siphonaria sp. JEL0065]